jgi:hypothetical protein
MSIAAFKRKSVIQYGSKRSGKGPGGYWLPQGPFGHATIVLQNAIDNPGAVGFSINGSHRNVGSVGRTYQMSKSGTPFRGLHPMGNGGTYGKYPAATFVGEYTGAITNSAKSAVVQPVFNSRVNASATQYEYVKQSVLSTKGMLEKRYRWAYNGQYPNYWVQPVYTGNQTDTASQLLYIQNKASANTCNLKVNNTAEYEGHIKTCGPTLCTKGRSTALFKYDDMARNAPYTKTLGQPVSYTQYNAYITRGCNNPKGAQKPFPFAVQTGTGIKRGGINVSRVGNACGTSNTYLTPPAWYTEPEIPPTLGNTPPYGLREPEGPPYTGNTPSN